MTIQEINQLFKRGSPAWYEAAYKSVQIMPVFANQVATVAKRVNAGMPRYKSLELTTTVPASLIGCLHNMEAACNFHAYLGNGELIVNTNERTKLVPKGRGPFQTFEEGALDALHIDGLTNVRNWSIGVELQYAERFNGLGYLLYHPEVGMSPYIAANTNMNTGRGKYVSDGHYDPSASSEGQVGVMAIYKQLELWGQLTIKFAT